MAGEVKTVQLSEDDFAKLGGKLTEIVQNQSKVDETLRDLKTGYEKIQADLTTLDERMKRDTNRITARLANPRSAGGNGRMFDKGWGGLGSSGAQDWLIEMAKFISMAWFDAHGHKTPDGLALSNNVKIDDLRTGPARQKAAADFTTGTASAPYAGYLLPEILRPGIIELRDIYGNLYPRLTRFTVPPGVNVRVPKDVTNPTAYWRGTQVTAMTEEGTPYTLGRGTINTELLGTYVQIANELLANPSVNFGSIVATRILRGINRKIEHGVLQGTDSGDEPSDGWLVLSTVWDQGTIASATFANIVTALKACVADNEWSLTEGENVLMMHPRDVLALATQAVGASELTGMLVWGNPRTGIPTTLLGHEVLVHPYMKVSTTYYGGMGDPGSILLAEDPNVTVDINPYLETAYKENSSWLRLFTHADWEYGQPTEFHKWVVTA